MASITSDKISGGAQNQVGQIKQLGCLRIVQMVDHARGQNQVKSALLSLNSSQAYVTAQEAPPGSEALLCRTDTFRANVESRVVDRREVIQNVCRPAPNIENFVPGSRFHVLSQINSPGSPPSHHPPEKPVTGREIQEQRKSFNDIHGWNCRTAAIT
jgi:hypothetical protein